MNVEDKINETVTWHSYDTLNRLVYEKQATGIEFNYSYDDFDRIKEISFFDGKLIYNYSLDALISISIAHLGKAVQVFEFDNDVKIEFEGKEYYYNIYEDQPYSERVMDRKKLNAFLDRKKSLSIIERQRKGMAIIF